MHDELLITFFGSIAVTSLGFNYTPNAGIIWHKMLKKKRSNLKTIQFNLLIFDTKFIDNSHNVNSKSLYSNWFTFILIPLSYLLSPKTIQIKISINDLMARIIEYFKEFLSQINFILYFNSTDGDRGMSESHDNYFAHWWITSIPISNLYIIFKSHHQNKNILSIYLILRIFLRIFLEKTFWEHMINFINTSC